ncbi:MAG TPA: hypothetical protein VES60_03760 [Nakamurella sp.]|nr:hypothetical protein [Nakamurella sp.]
MKLYRVHHIAIIAADGEASKRFYCDVLAANCSPRSIARTGIPGWATRR